MRLNGLGFLATGLMWLASSSLALGYVAFPNAPADICKISPGRAWQSAEVETRCPVKQYVEPTLGLNENVYYLDILAEKAFNRARKLKIKGDHNRIVAEFDVDAQKNVTLRTLQPQTHLIVRGLNAPNRLTVESEGVFVVTDSLVSPQSLRMSAEKLYLYEPPQVQGDFHLEYQEGFSRLTHHFRTRHDHGKVILENVEPVATPTAIRTALRNLPHQRWTIPVSYFEIAYRQVMGVDLTTQAAYQALGNEKRKRSYVLKTIHEQLNNEKKGDIAEAIYRKYLELNEPGYASHSTKIGRNGFDGVFSKGPVAPGQAADEVLIVEVKYNKAPLGERVVNGQNWRQLSVPYIQSVLSDYDRNPDTRETARIIRANQVRTKTKLAVFNPYDFILTIYEVGDMQNSRFN